MNLEDILAKNKYLRLAHYLEKNRGDWSGGYQYAEIGLRGFKVERELDKLIHNEISGLIETWCGDGRIFRDCEYSYNLLYGLVESSLMDKYNNFIETMEMNDYVL